MTRQPVSRPTIPRDSINPLGAETIVLPVKAPKLALMVPHSPRRSAREPLNAPGRESLLSSVVTPPRPTSSKQGARTALISKLRIVAPLLVIVAAGLIVVRVRVIRAVPTRATALRQHGTVTTQRAAVEPATTEAPQEPTTARIQIPVVDGKSMERQAVDAIARGAYSEAADLYERLARERATLQGGEVFQDAARIARRKSRRER